MKALGLLDFDYMQRRAERSALRIPVQEQPRLRKA